MYTFPIEIIGFYSSMRSGIHGKGILETLIIPETMKWVNLLQDQMLEAVTYPFAPEVGGTDHISDVVILIID